MKMSFDSAIDVDEGLGSILGGKLADFAKGLILKPRPLMVMYRPGTEEVLSFKIKRGVISHSLILNDEMILRRSRVTDLLEEMLRRSDRLKRQGYIEI